MHPRSGSSRPSLGEDDAIQRSRSRLLRLGQRNGRVASRGDGSTVCGRFQGAMQKITNTETRVIAALYMPFVQHLGNRKGNKENVFLGSFAFLSQISFYTHLHLTNLGMICSSHSFPFTLSLFLSPCFPFSLVPNMS